MNIPEIKTYEEFLLEYYPDWDDVDDEECPDCEGIGAMDCPTCGTAEIIECETCHGNGVLPNKERHRDEYEALKAVEVELWGKWTGYYKEKVSGKLD